MAEHLTLDTGEENPNLATDKKIETSFQLSNGDFKHKIRNLYLSTYPDNYSPDEVDEMLAWIEQNLSNSSRRRNCNAIDLLIVTVQKLLFYKNGEITVSFDKFLVLNGFINKIDQNVLYSLFLAINPVQGHNHRNLITHDNCRLKKFFQMVCQKITCTLRGQAILPI
ncbi:MAG: hypothetical protein ACK5JF_00175 [Oscillospiraceae bacterium]